MPAPTTTPKQAADLAQGHLSFSVNAPFRQLLNPREAAQTLCLIWRDASGKPRRFNTRFIEALMDRGEVEGIDDKAANPQTRELTKAGRKAKAFRLISRASLMAYCARHWTMPSDETARIILDYSRDLPVCKMRELSAAIALAADAKEDRMRDGAERMKMPVRRAA